jgi:transcriptional regulator GlxA family with amidase domain
VTEADSERKRRFDALFREHVEGVASYCRWRSRSDGEGIRARLRGMKERGALMTSVCTGALVYADAGLLDGQPAAT